VPIQKTESKGKSAFKDRKKIRNRLAWIEKRFNIIESELDDQRSITQDSSNGDNYDLLQQTMETMNTLEAEYLELMEEQEKLHSNLE
jgi:hypothetical protein